MRLRRLSTPLRLMLTALLALTAARLLAHVSHESYWGWLADIGFGALIVRWLRREYGDGESWRGSPPAHTACPITTAPSADYAVNRSD
jgi:hypothetical protein